jgi:2-polyprenyl-3-methyl-5-hydroxy-6-metoxy-1,4-benzoquinol methylase
VSGVTLSDDGVVTGNTYDKYGSANPVVRRLMAGFERELDELLARARPSSLLDVGCGEGVLVQRWAKELGEGSRLVGLDLEEESIQAGWAQHAAPNLSYEIMRSERLPFAEGEFDVVTAIEVLEHVPDPERTLTEMARCARSYLLVSVPREPLWRMLNIARGAYLRDLGNTPGHVNHFSKRSFARLLSRHGEVAELRSPFPWTMALVVL